MSQNKRITNNCFYFYHIMKCLSEEDEEDDNSSRDSQSVVGMKWE